MESRELIGLAYDGIDDPQAFQCLTEGICAAVGAVIGDIEVRRATSLAYVGSLGRMLPEAARSAYYGYWARHDPLAPVMVRQARFAVVSSDALMPRSELLKSSFYHEWMRPNGMDRFLGSVLPGPDELVLAVAFQRDYDRPYRDEDVTCVEKVLPHLARAFRLRQPLHELPARHARFVLDGDGKVVNANARANALLASAQVLTLERARLRFSANDVNAALDELVLAARAGMSGSRLLVMHASRARWVVHVRVDRLEGDPVAAPVRLIVEVAPSTWTPEGGQRILRATFGLSPAEAGIALGIFRGDTIEELAFALSISPLTARTQLKRVLAKTGTHRQPELMKLLSVVFSLAALE